MRGKYNKAVCLYKFRNRFSVWMRLHCPCSCHDTPIKPNFLHYYKPCMPSDTKDKDFMLLWNLEDEFLKVICINYVVCFWCHIADNNMLLCSKLFLEEFVYSRMCSYLLTILLLSGYVFNQQTVPTSFNFGGTPLGR